MKGELESGGWRGVEREIITKVLECAACEFGAVFHGEMSLCLALESMTFKICVVLGRLVNVTELEIRGIPE